MVTIKEIVDALSCGEISVEAIFDPTSLSEGSISRSSVSCLSTKGCKGDHPVDVHLDTAIDVNRGRPFADEVIMGNCSSCGKSPSEKHASAADSYFGDLVYYHGPRYDSRQDLTPSDHRMHIKDISGDED